MTAKKTTVPATRKYAPAPGVDSEFDEIWRRTKEGLDAAGNPEGLTDEEAREKLAKAFVLHGGKTYETVMADAIIDGIEENAEPAKPIELRVPTLPAEAYWYENPDDARMIEWYILSRRKLGNRMHGGLLITGPAGSGKTGGVPRAVERINRDHNLALPYIKMDCPTVTDPQKWFGRREIDAKGSRYEKSDFILAVESGAVILLDEFMRLHPTIHNPVMALLDGSESVLLSDLNVTINRHPETVFIGTTNIGSAFGGTHRMDWAMRERWSYTIERDFPPEDEEIRVLTSWTGCDQDAASILVDIAAKTRVMFATGDLRAPISTRTLVNAALLVAGGRSERSALEYTALPEYDGGADGVVGEKSERSQVKAVIEGRTRR